MQITTGIDIIEVDRIKSAVQELGDTFLNKIYTMSEIEYYNKSKGDIKYQHLAARFAAKEAVFKALSENIDTREDLPWKFIEVVNNDHGRPMINVEKLKEKSFSNLKSIDISISHIKEYAVASVVAVIE